jgi:plastocyanin
MSSIDTSSRSETPTSTTSAAAKTHTIKVGPKEDPHGYVPHSLTTNVGDLVVFEFYPRNHSVVQAGWKAPCIPADGDYFFSGIKNEFEEVNGQVVGRLPTWNLTIERDEVCLTSKAWI